MPNTTPTESQEFKITIFDIPPSLNHFAGRKNDREYQEQKRVWKELAYYACMPKPKEPMNKAIVTLTYYFKDKRRHDPDNYAGKMIMDGLTAAGVIKDDSFDCVELRLRGDYDKEKPRTEVLVESDESRSEAKFHK